MATPAYNTAIKSAANRTAYANNPVPRILVAKLPDKLRRIDPTGSSQWEADMQQKFDDFVNKMNAIWNPLNNTVVGLQRTQ